MKSLLTATLLLITAAFSCKSETQPDKWLKQLAAVILEHCPDATIWVTNGALTAKHETMLFTMHDSNMAGYFSPQTRQEEGPLPGGFVLKITLEQEPRATTQNDLPEQLQGPYYPTYHAQFPAADGTNVFRINFSYGNSLDLNLKLAILRAIRRDRRPGEAGSLDLLNWSPKESLLPYSKTNPIYQVSPPNGRGTASAAPSGPTGELLKTLANVVHEHCPDATIEAADGALSAKHRTMTFTVHHYGKDGYFLPQARPEEGPNYKGFSLRVRLVGVPLHAGQSGPGLVEFQGPYYSTLAGEIATADRKGYYQIEFSFARQLDSQLKQGILDALLLAGREPSHL